MHCMKIEVKFFRHIKESSEYCCFIAALSLAWGSSHGVLTVHHDRCAVPLHCASAQHWKPQWCQHSVLALRRYAKRQYASARRPGESSAAT